MMKQFATRFVEGSRSHLNTILLMCADTLALLTALYLALYLSVDSHAHIYATIQHFNTSLPFVIALYLGCFATFRLYRYAWRFASLEMLWGVIYANGLGRPRAHRHAIPDRRCGHVAQHRRHLFAAQRLPRRRRPRRPSPAEHQPQPRAAHAAHVA